jgi:hypothetical protein
LAQLLAQLFLAFSILFLPICDMIDAWPWEPFVCHSAWALA